MACNKIDAAITRRFEGSNPVKAVLDPYNPTGSTAYVNFPTSKTDRWETDSRKCHVNWVILDSDWEAESFFVRQAYFLGANDPYKSLKTTLKAEIDEEAWESLHSDTSRPFEKPAGGRIAVKVINHLGDEVMKVFRV